MNAKKMNLFYKLYPSYFLGVIFSLSAFLKAVNITAFSSEVQQYFELYFIMENFLDYKLCAVLVCMLEMTLGFMAFNIKYRRIIGIALFFVMSFFVYITGLNVFFPSEYFGSVKSCGCFGELIHFTPMESFIKSTMLWGISIINILFFFYKCNDHEIFSFNVVWNETSALLKDWFVYFIFILSCIPPLFSVNAVEDMDKSWYSVTYIMICISIMTITYIIWFSRKRTKYLELQN